MDREDSPDWLQEYKAPSQTAFDIFSESSPSSSPSPKKGAGGSQLDKTFNGRETLFSQSEDGEKNLQAPGVDIKDSDDEGPINRLLSSSKAVKGNTSVESPGGSTRISQKSARKRKSDVALGDEDSGEASPMKVARTNKKRVKQKLMDSGDDKERDKKPTPRKKKTLQGSGILGDKKTSTLQGRKTWLQKDETDGIDVEIMPQDNAGQTSDLEGVGSEIEKEVEFQERASGAAALAAFTDDEAFFTQDSLVQIEDAVVEDEDAEVQERKLKPRAASSLPLVFSDKLHRTKVLLECEGDALDLSGDMGAVGRFSVCPGRAPSGDELLLDLKGIIYKTTIVPSNSFFVVNVGQTEAKVEAIMNDFVQLRADTDRNENETMVEGTLEGFTFGSDDEGERLAGAGTGKATTASKEELEGSEDDGKPKKKKTPAKGPKAGKAPAKKAATGKTKAGRGKAGAKGAKKAATKKVTKLKASKPASAAKKTKSTT